MTEKGNIERVALKYGFIMDNQLMDYSKEIIEQTTSKPSPDKELEKSCEDLQKLIDKLQPEYICPKCGKICTQDYNSYWCDDCDRLYPKSALIDRTPIGNYEQLRDTFLDKMLSPDKVIIPIDVIEQIEKACKHYSISVYGAELQDDCAVSNAIKKLYEFTGGK